jgi:hypothetical protein
VSRLTWERYKEITERFTYGTLTLCGRTFLTVRLHSRRLIRPPLPACASSAPQPRGKFPSTGLGYSPFARHYWGNHYCFLFLRVLRCFTSPGSLPTTIDSSPDTPTFVGVGFPIQRSTDHSLVDGSPWLFAATRVFRRLLKPRHPPYALCSLVIHCSDDASHRENGTRREFTRPKLLTGPRLLPLLFFNCPIRFSRSKKWS